MPSSKPFVICTQATSKHISVVSSASVTTYTFVFVLGSMKGCKLLLNGVPRTGGFNMLAHHAHISLKMSRSSNFVCFTRSMEMIPSRESSDATPHLLRELKMYRVLPTLPILGPSSESTDTREIGTGFYLTNKQVDEWSKETLAACYPAYNEEETDDNPCAERWKNMKTALTAKMWGVFQETGLFLALCRHGFVLLLADMVRSGEL